MSGSLKVTRVLLVAAFAAGLSACSGGSDPAAGAAAPAVTVTVTAPATPSASPSDLPDPSNADSPEPETTLPESPSASATPSASPTSIVRGTDAEIMGPVKLLGANSITVALDHGGSQKAELTPFTVVLDRRGTICTEGGFPHECNVKQMRKALTSGGSLYAKVTIQDGVATQIEEMAKK